jgi:hypothetical protein
MIQAPGAFHSETKLFYFYKTIFLNEVNHTQPKGSLLGNNKIKLKLKTRPKQMFKVPLRQLACYTTWAQCYKTFLLP